MKKVIFFLLKVLNIRLLIKKIKKKSKKFFSFVLLCNFAMRIKKE